MSADPGARVAAMGLALVLLLAAVLVQPAEVSAATGLMTGPRQATDEDEAAPYVPGVVIVGYRQGTGSQARLRAQTAVRALASRPLSRLARGAERLTLPADLGVPEAIARLRRQPVVRYAEPDYVVRTAAVPDDPIYTSGDLWGMYGAGTSPANAYGSAAGEAWALGHTGSADVFVGVIDEGIQLDHPDLDANIWTNPFDALDGQDNDGNGYVDDIHGWDFLNDDNSVFDGSPADPDLDAHGTHVAGTIAAEGGNGQGVAGVNWSATLIVAKFLEGTGQVSDAVRALDYLTDLRTRHGLDIVATSNSWGGGGSSQALLDAINRSGDAGMLFVAAAGNGAVDTDLYPDFPSTYQCTRRFDTGQPRGHDCIVSVASITRGGALSSFSNHGMDTVDLGAPGSGIWSSVPIDDYASFSGTSMATPHVSGAIALCRSSGASLSASALRSRLLGSTAATESLEDRTVTGGRLDIGRLVRVCAPSTVPVSGAPSDLLATVLGRRSIELTWLDGVSDEVEYQIQRAAVAWDSSKASGETLSSCGPFTTIATLGADAERHRVRGLQPGTAYCFRVRGANDFAGGSSSPWSDTVMATTLPEAAEYHCPRVPFTWVDATLGGTKLSLADDDAATVDLPAGFELTFFGQVYPSVRVSSNGFLRFGSGEASRYANTPIPYQGQPNAIVAAFWDDLDPAKGGEVWTRVLGEAPSRRFVASWLDVRHANAPGRVSFQVLLDEAGDSIGLAYADVRVSHPAYDRGASATVGLEDQEGGAGTQISFNTPILANDVAYRCASGEGAPLTRVVVDDLDPGSQRTGSGWRQSDSGFRKHSYWTVVRKGTPVRRGTWRAGLLAASAATHGPSASTAGLYDVHVYIPARSSTTRRARYRITTTDRIVTRVIDQSRHRNRWVKLGRFELPGEAIVRLTDKTGERTRSGRRIAFDAVRFVAVTTAVAVDASPEPTPATLEPDQSSPPEAQAEPSPGPTEGPTTEPIPGPTPEPTPEPTPGPTREPTPEPTPEPTTEPTREPTPELTPEAARSPDPESDADPQADP